jgi:hypothetical protein
MRVKMLRRKGKDKAKEHFQKMGKYDGKATRRLVAFYEKLDRKTQDTSKVTTLVSTPVSTIVSTLETLPVSKN